MITIENYTKKKVITLYASQVSMLLAALVCAALPFFIDFPLMKDWRAVAGLFAFACAVFLNVWFIRFFGRYPRIVGRFVQDSLPVKLWALDVDYQNGRLSETEAKEQKERLKSTYDGYCILNRLEVPFMIFDCVVIFLLAGSVVLKLYLQQSLCFFDPYAASALILIVQTISLCVSLSIMYYSGEAQSNLLQEEEEGKEHPHDEKTHV